MQESDRARNSSGVGFPAKPGNRRRSRYGNVETRVWYGFPSSVGRTTNLRQRFRHRSHGASFPQRTRNSAHFGANVVVGCCARPKSWFPESRVECTLLQILVQSRILGAAQESVRNPDFIEVPPVLPFLDSLSGGPWHVAQLQRWRAFPEASSSGRDSRQSPCRPTASR